MTTSIRILLRRAIAASLLAVTGSAYALNTTAIIGSVLSPDCLAYRVVGICYWLLCTPFGCSIETSVKVKHYVPDAVVSAYSNTGRNPWTDVSFMSAPIAGAQAGGDGTTNQQHEDNLAKFKNADVIGHPGTALFSQFAGGSGYVCPGAGQPFTPYLLSTFDTLAWRYDIPEVAYPESLTPGLREIGSRSASNLWGSVYPRGGFLHQADDFKAAAVVTERAGDIVTRPGQLHVYQPLLATAYPGYWPAGPLIESDSSTGKWQALAPTLSDSCAVFPDTALTHPQARDGGYVWALWRPYSCCESEGDTFLGSVDFSN